MSFHAEIFNDYKYISPKKVNKNTFKNTCDVYIDYDLIDLSLKMIVNEK